MLCCTVTDRTEHDMTEEEFKQRNQRLVLYSDEQRNMLYSN